MRSNYSRNRQPECWNGTHCSYLRRNMCNFYHPQSHYIQQNQQPSHIQRRSNNETTSTNINQSTIFYNSMRYKTHNNQLSVSQNSLNYHNQDSIEIQSHQPYYSSHQQESLSQQGSDQLSYAYNGQEHNNLQNTFQQESNRSRDQYSWQNSYGSQDNISSSSRIEDQSSSFDYINDANEQFQWFFQKNNQFKRKNITQKQVQKYNQCPICFEQFDKNKQDLNKRQNQQQIIDQQKDQQKQKSSPKFNSQNETIKQEKPFNAQTLLLKYSICESQNSQKSQKVTKTSSSAKQILIQLYCSHIYHKDCIQGWLKKNPKCPVCRHDFRDHKNYAEWDEDYKDRFQQQKQEDDGPENDFYGSFVLMGNRSYHMSSDNASLVISSNSFDYFGDY